MSGKKLSFLEIAKLNKDKVVKKEIVVENEKEDDEDYLDNDYLDNEDDINIKNTDVEFEKEYNMKIIDIKVDFLEFVRKNYNYSFFFNKQYNTSKYNFYDYIKYCSNNYYDVIKKTNKDNDEYIKLLEEEEKQKNENEEYIEDDQNYYPYKY
jgi:hypothetical protein